MEILDQVHEVVANAAKGAGTVRHVVWVAAGGSNGGFYPAHYFMTHEAKTVSSQMFTSNEFVMAPPAYLGPDTVAVICSMRGTPETCKAAQVAKDHGAATIGLYVQESLLTQTCDQLIAYESIALDESRTERVNSSVGLALAMELVDQTEGYAHMAEAKRAFAQVDGLYRKAVERTTPLAADWAKQNKDERVIYVMGSGPAYGSAYIFSICNIEEMLQIASPTINSCEVFHGPSRPPCSSCSPWVAPAPRTSVPCASCSATAARRSMCWTALTLVWASWTQTLRSTSTTCSSRRCSTTCTCARSVPRPARTTTLAPTCGRLSTRRCASGRAAARQATGIHERPRPHERRKQ